MSHVTRRDFVKQTTAGAVAAAALGVTRVGQASAAKKNIAVAVIGCGGRGQMVGECFAKKDGVTIPYVCDVNSRHLAEMAKKLNVPESHAVSDLRKVLDDASVDAVLIATPDHWHAPAAIMACDAGKHVYVEKPCSHNVREGRLLVEAARRNDRVVQHGTQVRSTPMIIEAVKLLRDGIIGDVLVAKVWNVQMRGTIGHSKPGSPPEVLDYDTWVGPAPMVPFQANTFGNWHSMYHFGTGDMGNDGVHDIDYGRWGLGAKGHPAKIAAFGGKYVFQDDQEFPDTQQVTFEYAAESSGSPRLLIYEQRLWSTNYPSVYNCDSGVEYYGTKGRMFLSRRGKLQVLGPGNRRLDVAIKTMPQDHELHVDNFLDCIRSGERPNADIEEGHFSSALCHLGNVATRLGRSLNFDSSTEKFFDDDEANSLLSREYRSHWGTPKDA